MLIDNEVDFPRLRTIGISISYQVSANSLVFPLHTAIILHSKRKTYALSR